MSPRTRIALYIAATTLAGLATRLVPGVERAVGKYPGDVLYAVLAVWLVLFCAPRMAAIRAALLGFALAALVEFSKLWPAPRLLSLRHTRLGGLLLGHKFLWADLACYALGAALAYAIDRAWLRRAFNSA